MINLLVDEAYAFDYLSILEIKKNLNQNNHNFYANCLKHISDQFELSFFQSILDSKEYKSLINTNKEVFDAVEQARYGNISAKEVDEKNMKRYYAKQALQNKFFSDTPIKEFKT
jgi:hypothetical protein